MIDLVIESDCRSSEATPLEVTVFVLINAGKVFKNGPTEICRRQPLKFEVVRSALTDHITSNFSKAVFQHSHFVHF